MTIDDNREVVLRFCRQLSERNVDAMFSHVAEGASWRMLGRPDRCPFGKIHNREEAYQQLKTFLAIFETFEFTVVSTTAEGDRVAVQAESSGRGPGQKAYKNRYMMLYQLQNAQIISIDEYFDPLEVFAYLEMPE